MDDVTKIITAIFGGVILVAIASVIVGRKSQAPQAIQAIGTSISSVVAAAVNPVSATYGYGNGSSTFSSPSVLPFGNFTSMFSFSPISPGGSK